MSLAPPIRLRRQGKIISRTVDELDQVQADIHGMAQSFDRNAGTANRFHGLQMPLKRPGKMLTARWPC